MKNKIENAFAFAILGGFVGYKIFEKSYSLSTTDWAAKGVPITERLWDTTTHGAPGLLIGIIAGFFIGILIPQKLLDKIPNSGPEKVLRGEIKYITSFLLLGFLFVYFYFFEPTVLTVTINFIILAVLYYFAVQVFGVPSSKNENEKFLTK
ncbi:MAG: hypothetical protein OEY59_12140 [Deltaproteobacteria bacterium]|nr:hypothetical protein [Deltaproteobacteria bacterium]